MSNLEKFYSILRVVIEFVGLAMTVSSIPFLANLLDALVFIDLNADSVFNSVGAIVGFALTVYGFFLDPARGSISTLGMSTKRFEDRVVGLSTCRAQTKCTEEICCKKN